LAERGDIARNGIGRPSVDHAAESRTHRLGGRYGP
jgi:hypothetical protein